MLDIPVLPFIEAASSDTQGLLVDPACTGQDCFSVVDTYGPDQSGTEGFTVWDYHAPNYSGPPPSAVAGHTQGLYVDSACTGDNCFNVTNTFDGNPNNPNGTEGFSVFDYMAPDYSGPPQQYLPSLAPPQPAVVVAPAAEDPVRGGKAHPSHLILCGHAMLLGALSATYQSVAKGTESWTESFARETKEAAAAVTPVGGYVLTTHVFKK